MIGNKTDNALYAKLCIFDKDVVEKLHPYGELEFACVGVAKGWLHVLSLAGTKWTRDLLTIGVNQSELQRCCGKMLH